MTDLCVYLDGNGGAAGPHQLYSLALYTGNTPSSGLMANFKRGSSFDLTERGRLSALTVYLEGNGDPNSEAEQDIRFALYRDSNGVPGTKVAESQHLAYAAVMLKKWITVQPTSRPLLEPGRYWFIIHTGAHAGTLRYFADGVPGQWYGNADLFRDGTSPTFGAGNVGNGTLSAFISYEPE